MMSVLTQVNSNLLRYASLKTWKVTIDRFSFLAGSQQIVLFPLEKLIVQLKTPDLGIKLAIWS